MFGATSTFGSTAPTFGGGGGFTAGATATNAFGSPQQTGSPLFGNTTGFNTNKSTGFGTSFGSPQSTSLFGQQNRLVGNTTMFSNTGTGTLGPFANTTSQAQGTSIPFKAITGSDTMMKNGGASPINTLHQCISCMKEYEHKSLEELRLEDYQLGRKGSAQQNSMFGSTQSQPAGLFSSIAPASNTTSTFGQRPATFGTTTQQPAGGLFSNLNPPKQTNFFGNTATSTGTFGTTTGGFAFPTSQPNLFGQTNTSVSTAGGIGPSTGFAFNPPQQQQMSLGVFGQKSLTAPTVTSQQPFGFGQQTNTAITKPPTLFSSTPAFSQTPAFGTQPQQTGNLFGTSQPKAFTFGQTPVSSAFGAPVSTAAPFSFTNQASTTAFGGTSLFGSNTTTTPSTGFSTGGFGAPSLSLPASSTGFTGFNIGNSTLGSSTGFSFNPSNAFGQQTSFQQTTSPATGPVPFATTPYKDSPLFYNLITNRNLENMTKPTNPLAQRAVKEASRRRSSTALGSVGQSVAMRQLTFAISKTPMHKQTSLFDGYEEEDHGLVIDILSPKTSVKKLSLNTVRGIQRLSLPTMQTTLNESLPVGYSSLNETSDFHSEITPPPLNNECQPVEHEKLQEEEETDRVSVSFFSPNGSRRELFPEQDEYGMEGVRRLPLETERDFSPSPPPPTPLTVLEKSKTEDCGIEAELAGLPIYNPKSKEELEKLIAGKKVKSSGVVCTLFGYYTMPSVPELDLYTDSEGNCFIRGFCVGRTRYGQVRFIDVVNVAGLNINEIVMFRHKEVVVYPDHMSSPPVGQGLNVRAQIRLERIWPIDKQTREYITKPSMIRAMKYEDLLRRSCERMDATFLSYDDTKGVWNFVVKHFSKYSCVPEEDDEELSPPKAKIPAKGLGGITSDQLRSLGPKITETHLMGNESQSFVTRKPQNGQQAPERIIPAPPIHDGSPLAESILSSRHTMGSIFFPQDSFGFSLDDSLKREKFGEIEESKYKDKSGFESDYDEKEIPSETLDESDLEDLLKKHIAPRISSTLLAIPHEKEQRGLIRFGESILPGDSRHWQYRKRDEIRRRLVSEPIKLFTRLFTDGASIALPPRSTRVCFGPKGHFLQILNNTTMSPFLKFHGEVSVKKIESRMKAMEDFPGNYRGILETQLNVYLERSNLSENDTFMLNFSGMISSHIKAVNDILRDKTRTPSDHAKSLREEIQVWALLDILWSGVMDGMRGRDFEMNQRARLGVWLKGNGSMLFSKLFVAKDNSVKGLVLKGKKFEASKEAIRNKNPRLALCLAQNNPASQHHCRAQIEVWEKQGVLAFIDSDLLELYALCAGFPIWGELDFNGMTTSEWLLHFATFIWYLAPSHLSIDRVVSFFQTTIKDAVPEVTEDYSAPAKSSSTMANLCIHLLKMYSSVGYPVHKLLSPTSNNPDVLEYKVSWCLLQTLRLLGYQIESGLIQSITTAFANELETLGIWEWAIFVLKFLPLSEPRNISIKRMLERNLNTRTNGLTEEVFEHKISLLKKIGLSQEEIEKGKL